MKFFKLIIASRYVNDLELFTSNFLKFDDAFKAVKNDVRKFINFNEKINAYELEELILEYEENEKILEHNYRFKIEEINTNNINFKN